MSLKEGEGKSYVQTALVFKADIFWSPADSETEGKSQDV